MKELLAIATGLAAGITLTAWYSPLSKDEARKYLMTKGGLFGEYPVILCHKHPGNGLLVLSNGDIQCFDCAKEIYGKVQSGRIHDCRA